MELTMAHDKRVLVAEDEPDIRGLITFSLEYAGFDVLQATNGADAVKLATENLPDLVLLDVRMPKMTGYEACTALKAQDSTKHIPVVFLSARGQETEIKRGLKLGAVEYILKPFAPDELYQRVAAILERESKKRS
jgi:DNA-binding response OmpR family regulator